MASYVKPDVIENQYNKDPWVEYGKHNSYFQYVSDRYYGSPTNGSLIRSITDRIYGGGLMVEDGTEQQQIKLDELFRPDEVRKMTFDYYLQGMFSFEVIFTRDGISEINHIPIETVRPNKANEEGEIEKYWLSANWEAWTNKNDPRFKPIPVPAWGFDESEGKQIFVLRQYSPDSFYFSQPVYISGLQWAKVEEEISNFHVNNIMNAFMPSAIINYNNGVPPKEIRDRIERETKAKFTGTSNSGQIVVAFNDSSDNAVTIDSFQLNNAHEQYQQLDEAATKNILAAHRCVSPMLIGLKDNTGLGNNADELRTASLILDSTVIRPRQNEILEAFDEVLEYLNIDVPIIFENLEPLEVTNENQDETQEVSQPVNVDMHKHDNDFTDEEGHQWLEALKKKGELIDSDEWELVEEVEVDDPENEPLEFQFIQNEGAILSNSNPQDRSKGDSGLFKIRYRYSTNISQNSRDFCRVMVSDSKGGTVFRREDITKMSRAGVNGEFAPEGKSTYSLWSWKGGAYCHHKWVRVVYRRRRGVNGQSLPKSETAQMENDRKSTVGGALTAGVPSDKVTPKGWNAANTAPINTPSRGSLKNG